MKYLLTIVVAVAVGFAAAFLIVSKTNPVPPPDANTSTISSDNSTAPKPAEAASLSPQKTPVEMLQQLAQLTPAGSKDPARVVRQIIHNLEGLTDARGEAIHPISAFIASGTDIDYILLDTHTAGAPFWNWHPGQPVLSGLVLPPSLRLSLVDVLRNIGGQDAEVALGVMLATATRPVEVAYISVVLQKMAPDKYKEVALTAAKKLLSNPLPASTSPLDAAGAANLYGVLTMHGDTSLVDDLKSKLVNNGQFDADAAKYLIGALGTQAMPLLAQIYPTANAEDKNKINNLAFNYVGPSADANTIFKDWVLNNNVQDASGQGINARPRPTYIEMLAGGNFGLYQAPVPSDPNVIIGRIGLLNDLNASDSLNNSPLVKQAIAQTLAKLQAIGH